MADVERLRLYAKVMRTSATEHERAAAEDQLKELALLLERVADEVIGGKQAVYTSSDLTLLVDIRDQIIKTLPTDLATGDYSEEYRRNAEFRAGIAAAAERLSICLGNKGSSGAIP